MSTAIDRVGFEIEGGWAGERYLNPFKDATKLIGDNSINGQTLNGAPPIKAVHIGEAVSEPIPYRDMEVWKKWLTDHWPNAEPKHRTNRTCGFHIHLSTYSSRDYMLLTGKGFLYGLRERLVSLGKALKLPERHIFWERMEGKNTFCRFEFDASQQMTITPGERHGNRLRYGWLNFARDSHGTLEFRALPTFRDAHVAIRFTQEYLEYVDEYLDRVRKDEIVYKTSLRA